MAADFELPVFLTHAGSERLFVVEKRGSIQALSRDGKTKEVFLDISVRVGSTSNEQGLLGLAFHPQYAENGWFFVDYTDLRGDTVVSRFQVPAGAERADPDSEEVFLRIPQPAANHNGGMIAFGPDGALYIGTGDGGAANDRFRNGQNRNALLGKLLRIRVDGAPPYAIPPDNPFVGQPDTRPEIWALGLRNPWRFSFDRATGDLFIADVGQNEFEEIDWQPAGSLGGENYGWPIMEGLHCFQRADCDRAGLTLPIVEYDHTVGCSVTGGYVYRGQRFPALRGVYFYADYCSGTVWALWRDARGQWQHRDTLHTDLRISSFGEDVTGEIYLLDLSGGGVYRLALALPTSQRQPVPPPQPSQVK